MAPYFSIIQDVLYEEMEWWHMEVEYKFNIDLMYRPSNERYSEGGNMKPHNSYPYPPLSEHSIPKMHMDGYQSTMPPVYEYLQNNSFDYMPPNNNPGPPENFDRGYPPPNWRDPS